MRRADLLDRTDPQTGDTSMARTTGHPAIIVAKLMAEGALAGAGIVPAETLGRDAALLQSILAELSRCRIALTFSTHAA
jgi:saccharopine dehydrogenase-like NADP-dependent oxidoreductase